MSRDEYNRMLLERLHGEQRWENAVAVDWAVADLDVDELVRTVEEAIRREVPKIRVRVTRPNCCAV